MCASSHSHKRPVFFLHFAVDEQCLYCVQVSQSLLPMRRAALHPLEQHRKMTGRGRDTEVIVGVGVSVGVCVCGGGGDCTCTHACMSACTSCQCGCGWVGGSRCG